MDKERSEFCPKAKAFEEQGYKDFLWYNAIGVSAPEGTPCDIEDTFSRAVKKAVETPKTL